MFTNFSPNMLKTYQTCPKKFFYKYVEKVNVPTVTSKFEKGKKIHALANYYLQGVNITRLEGALNPQEKEVWDALLNNPFFQKEFYRSEYNLSCKISDFWVGGRLDAVVTDNERSKYYILDYKTGDLPKNPHYDFQTMIYLLALDRFLNENYKRLSFVYINLKLKNNHVIDFNETLKQEYEKNLESICSDISSESEFPCNFENCRNCEYSKLCLQ